MDQAKPTAPKREKATRIAVKAYVVLQRRYAARGDTDNVHVIAVKLTAAAAQKIVDELPGTFIEKRIATK